VVLLNKALWSTDQDIRVVPSDL